MSTPNFFFFFLVVFVFVLVVSVTLTTFTSSHDSHRPEVVLGPIWLGISPELQSYLHGFTVETKENKFFVHERVFLENIRSVLWFKSDETTGVVNSSDLTRTPRVFSFGLPSSSPEPIWVSDRGLVVDPPELLRLPHVKGLSENRDPTTRKGSCLQRRPLKHHNPFLIDGNRFTEETRSVKHVFSECWWNTTSTIKIRGKMLTFYALRLFISLNRSQWLDHWPPRL